MNFSIDLITKYFASLSKTQIDQYSKMYMLYQYWNDKINVISRNDFPNFYLHHVLNSLSIAKFISFEKDTKVLDVGTGGGFPGIPLAILFPEVHFVLVESIAKKCKVAQDISNTLNLKNIFVKNERVEKMNQKFDFILSRAVASIPTLLKWTNDRLEATSRHHKKNGHIMLKGGDLEDELKTGNSPFEQISVSRYFSESFFDNKKIIYIPLSA